MDALQQLNDLGPLLHQPVQLIVDVVRVALESLQTQIQQSETLMTYKIPEDLPSVMGDARQIEMALMNVIGNALCKRHLSQSSDRRLSLTAAISPDHITLSVEDTGTGFLLKTFAAGCSMPISAQRPAVAAAWDFISCVRFCTLTGETSMRNPGVAGAVANRHGFSTEKGSDLAGSLTNSGFFFGDLLQAL